jgi:prepilin-type processing-associated H-X9-DG protein
MSFAANAIETQSALTNWQNKQLGVFAQEWQSWINPVAVTSTSINHSAETVLLAPKYNGPAVQFGGYGVLSGFAGNTFFNFNWFDWSAPGEIPNGNTTASYPWNNNAGTAYPATMNGAVGLTSSLKTNIGFVDGHTKAMAPVATNPDPVNLPMSNMWDATR